MNELEILDAKIKHTIGLHRKWGTAEFRLDAFERYAREGKWRQAQRALWKEPICGARRPNGKTCMASPRYHGRCCRHGGGDPNPGPKTEAGRQRIAEAQRRRWALWRAQRDQASPF